jgi:hypothetical protein
MQDNLTLFLKQIDATDPRTTNFEEIELDEQIKEFVINVNKSNWIYTLYSCQGHYHENNSHTLPYFVFIVENNRIKDFLLHIYNTVPTYNHNNIKLPGIAENAILLTENNEIIKLPLIGGHDCKINPTYSNEHYSTISIYWDEKCIDNEEFYDKLKQMAKQIISTNNTKHFLNCS